MNKLTQTYQITSELHNFCRTFEDDLTKPQMSRLKELIHGIIRGGKGILSEVARQNRGKQGKTVRKQVEQYSNMLGKLPLENMLVRKIAGLRSKIQNDTPLYLDLTDITKENHKSMERIGTTWNGSEGVPGKGYEIVDVSVGLENMGMSLYRHLYSTGDLDYGSQVKEIRKALEVLSAAWGEIRGTGFVDSGGDNNRLIGLFLEFEMSFVIRMNVNRGSKDRVVLDERGDRVKMMELWGKTLGVCGWTDAKGKKRKIVRLQWRKIYMTHQKKSVPLWLVRCHREGDPDPCVFLTSRSIDNVSDAEKVYRQYFERGGKEEAVFKLHKEKLGMEKVQLCSLKKVKQLMLVYVLADQLLAKLQEEALEAGKLLHTFLVSFLRGVQRRITKWAVIDFYDHTCAFLERDLLQFRNRFRPSVSRFQLSLFPDLNEKW